jgi:hypothetical protein
MSATSERFFPDERRVVPAFGDTTINAKTRRIVTQHLPESAADTGFAGMAILRILAKGAECMYCRTKQEHASVQGIRRSRNKNRPLRAAAGAARRGKSRLH